MPNDAESPDRRSPWMIVCAVVWILGFSIWFYASDLPNNSPSPDQKLHRSDIWRLVFVETFPLLNPLDYSQPKSDAGWKHLSQRLPFLQAAAPLFLSALLFGCGVIQCCRFQMSLLFSERLLISFGVGISLQSLWILAGGWFGLLSWWVIVVPGGLGLLLILTTARKRSDIARSPVSTISVSLKLRLLSGLLVAPFVLHLLLGSMTPSTDFDVREYHLQGPREWFQQGAITNLDHNVYTSFPFLSEMLSLGTMVLANDVWTGAIAGKLILATFPLFSALCAYSIATRHFGQGCGLLAACVTLSTPWVTRIGIIAYAEGSMMFFVTLSAMVALLAIGSSSTSDRWRLTGLAGIACGSAMAAKYTGLVTAVLPVGGYLLWMTVRQDKSETFRLAGVFIVGITIAVGPWLLKNFVTQKNPVYPLAYSIFGAKDWDLDLDQRWQKAHQPNEHELSRIPTHLNDFAVRNDWQNGLLFAFAVPSLLLIRRQRSLLPILSFVTWLIVTWWALTHRIDRFWVPMIPLAAVAGGSLWRLSENPIWHRSLLALLCVSCTYNFAFVRSPLIGFHGGLTEIGELKQQPIRRDIAELNRRMSKTSKVLMVGEAEVFDCEFPLLYNTVFDDSLFQQLTCVDGNQDEQLADASIIRQRLTDAGVTHIFVNWSEILRYRDPASYGYSDYVTPKKFQTLVSTGLLKEPEILSQRLIESLNQVQADEIRSWPGITIAEGIWNDRLLYEVATP